MKNNMFKKAFTLVEILIVVIIIGILIAALIPKFSTNSATFSNLSKQSGYVKAYSATFLARPIDKDMGAKAGSDKIYKEGGQAIFKKVNDDSVIKTSITEASPSGIEI